MVAMYPLMHTIITWRTITSSFSTALCLTIIGVALILRPVIGWSGTFELPLKDTNGWQFLNYRKIPPNTFRATPTGLKIVVDCSAAPAIFPLTNHLEVTELQFNGQLSGVLKIPPGKQGEKGYDDYAIRVGLVESGSHTLSRWEKKMAPDWVKRLFALAPPGTGVSKICFFNIGTDPKQVGQTRIHPLSNLIQETVVAVPDADGRFAVTNHLAHPLKALAVWIACDGDDTKSSFKAVLYRVELQTRTGGGSE